MSDYSDSDCEFTAISKENALQDFNIVIDEYVEEIISIDDIIYLDRHHMILLNYDIGPYYRNKNWTKVIEKMNLWYANLMMTIKNPDILTSEEMKQLKKMEAYMNNNHGKLIGAYKYRYKAYQQKVKEYKDLVLKNKMMIIAYRFEIDERVQQYRDLLNLRIEKDEKAYSIKRDADKKRWGYSYYTCECGKEVQKVNRSHHIKQKQHIDWVKENKTDENIVICSSTLQWHQKKYKCSCGKEISNSNRFNHEKTPFHKLHEKESPSPNDTPSENIILTIQEIGRKSIADLSNVKTCSYDNALVDF